MLFCAANLLFRRGPGVATCSTHFIPYLRSLLCITSTLYIHSTLVLSVRGPLVFLSLLSIMILPIICFHYFVAAGICYTHTLHKETIFIPSIYSVRELPRHSGNIDYLLHSNQENTDVLLLVVFQVHFKFFLFY